MHSEEPSRTLKGSYDDFFLISLFCVFGVIFWHALMFKKHIIFQILYIIVGPPCPASLKHLVLYKVPPSSAVCSDWSTGTVHCDWLNTISTSRKFKAPFHNRKL